MIRSSQRETGGHLELGAGTIGVAELVSVARDRSLVALSLAARARVSAGHETLVRLAHEGAQIYGLTTGVGALDSTPIDLDAHHRAQAAFLRSHAAGIGAPLAGDVVRAGMLVRANQLSGGQSGIQVSSLEAYLCLLNSHFTPVVPDSGSLGAADLCSLAQIALLLIGDGEASTSAGTASGAQVLRELSLEPQLGWRDAFALVASPAMSTGLGALLVHDAQALIELSETACALHAVGQEALRTSWDAELVAMVPHEGAQESARRMRELLSSSLSSNTAVREVLSIRSSHRVHGAARDAHGACARAIEIEINAGIDNPCLLASQQHTNNAANFHAQELAQTLDTLGSALIAMAVASERRIARAQLASSSEQATTFLSDGKGEHSGAMIAHYTAASLVAELRMNAVPAAIQSISVCNGSEDISPMCWLAARRLQRIVATCQQVTAIELWTSRRAISMGGLTCPPGLEGIYQALGGRELDDEQPVSAQLRSALAVLKSR